jgi:hypothetical protein
MRIDKQLENKVLQIYFRKSYIMGDKFKNTQEDLDFIENHQFKVVVTDKTKNNGYQGDKDLVTELLELNKPYNLKSMDVGRSSSTIELVEFPNRNFNSVNFEFLALETDINEKGYVVIKNAIDSKLLDLIPRDFELVGKVSLEEDVFRTANGDVKQIQNLQNYPVFKNIANEIQEKLGYKGEIMNMQYFIKHPEYKITAPHQDGAYFDDLDDDIITFWIPLHDVNVKTSTMFYIDWDGKREIIPHDNCGRNVRNRTGKVGMSQYTSQYDLSEFKPVELKYGDLVAHNQFSVHYSNENSTDLPRIAITCIIKLNKK